MLHLPPAPCRLAAVIAIACTGLPDRASASDESIETLTVVASRSPLPIATAPVPVEVVAGAALDTRAPADLAAVLADRRGFTVSRAGGVGQFTEARLRGAESNHLQVRIDGVEINDPATGYIVDLAHVTVSGAERVEILRGAQSALWGSDALAGIVHVDTTPPPASVDRRASFESGSFDTITTLLSLAGADDSRHGALVVRHVDSDGTNVAVEGSEDDAYRNTTLHVNVGWRGDRSAVRAVARSLRADTDIDPTPFPDFVPADGDLEQRLDHRLGGVAADFGLDTRLVQRLRANVLETDTVSYENGGRTGSAAGRRLRFGWQGDYRYGDDDGALSLAAEYTREGFHQRGIATAFGDPRQNQTMDATSVVAEWRAPLGPVAVSTSVRHDRASDFRDATTYRLAARLPLDDGTALFAAVGTGARNPTFTDRYGFTPDTFIGNPDLDVERSISYSFAIERAFGASLTAGVALFRDRLEDEIESFVFDADLGGFTARNSNGRSHRDGIEPWLRWQATDALAVEADYAFVDATEPDATGRSEEVRRARHSGALRVHWLPVPRFALTAGAAHVGERRDFDFAAFPARRVRLGEYTLLHCAARWWANERIELGFRAENATNADYEDVLGYRSPGRSLTFTVSGRF